MNRTLEQSATSRPFMRKPSLFAVITERAGQYGVIHIVTRPRFSATDRDSVVKLKDVFSVFFLEFLKAVVTSILLSFQFDLDLLSSKCTGNGFTSNPAPLVCQPVFNRMSAAILSLICIALLSMAFPVYSIFLLFVGLIVVFSIHNELISVLLSIGFVVCAHLLFVRRIPCPCFGASTRSLFRTLSLYLFLGIAAFLAIRTKVFSSIVMEVLSGSGEHAHTWAFALLHRGILGYSIHAVEPPTFNRNGLGSACNAPKTQQIFPHYTTKPPLKQFQEVFYAIH